MTATDTNTEARTLDEALQDMSVAMVGTADDGVWKSRPLTLAGRRGSTLEFLVSGDADWVQGIESGGAPTSVTFSDPSTNDYVSLQGRVQVLSDAKLIDELWNPGAEAYFDGREDPSVRVLSVDVESGEYWDSPSGTIGRLLALTRAAAGGDAGKEGPIKV